MVSTDGGKMRGLQDQMTRRSSPEITHIIDTATYTMQPHEHIVEVDTSVTACNITLPPCALCAGGLYSFRLYDAGSNDLDLLVPNSDALDTSTIEALDFDADNDNALLYCDGRTWYVVVNGIA